MVAIIWKPGFYRNNQSPFLLNCYLYALQTYRTHPSKLRLLLVYVIFDIMSSNVAGMIGLINKTKGLRFCNVSGFLELYNDPQVRLSAINSQSFHSKYPRLLIDYCWLIICLAILKKKFNHRRQTSRFLLTGSWQDWLKRWVNYRYDSKYKKWRLLEPSYCFFLVSSHDCLVFYYKADVPLFISTVFKKVFCTYTKCYWVIWFPLMAWQKSSSQSSWSVLY